MHDEPGRQEEIIDMANDLSKICKTEKHVKTIQNIRGEMSRIIKIQNVNDSWKFPWRQYQKTIKKKNAIYKSSKNSKIVEGNLKAQSEIVEEYRT